MSGAAGRETRFVAALESYDMRRDPDDHVLEKALPDELGVVHAVNARWFKYSLKQPQFLDRFDVEEALCGRRVRVLLPLAFKPLVGDEDQCARCRERLLAGATAPPLRRRRFDEDTIDASEGTGIAPSSGHVWTGRTWTFGAVDEVADEDDEESTA